MWPPRGSSPTSAACSRLKTSSTIAREIQRSILPDGAPELEDLRISAAYHPMTAVAGDFYEFIPVDEDRMGFLVADVSGHGVPAALIAAMIKVAMQSVVSSASRPGGSARRFESYPLRPTAKPIRFRGLFVA